MDPSYNSDNQDEANTINVNIQTDKSNVDPEVGVGKNFDPRSFIKRKAGIIGLIEIYPRLFPDMKESLGISLIGK